MSTHCVRSLSYFLMALRLQTADCRWVEWWMCSTSVLFFFFFIFVVVSIVDVEEITFIMSSWPKRTILLIINSSNHSTVQCRSCPFGCKCYTAGRTLVISIRIAYKAEYSWRVKRSEWNPMTSPPSPNLNRIVFAPQPHICHLKIFCLFIHHHRLCVFVWECMCKYNICLRLRLTLAPSASK